MRTSTQRLAAIAGIVMVTVAVSATSAIADVNVPLPGGTGNCVFVGQVTIGNPLYSTDLVKSDPKTGVYTGNNCPH